MAFVNYKNTNNASSLLISDITASATTILITDWDQNLFPSNFPFLLTLEHLDTNENVILREIVKVVWRNQNTFTVERSAWTCVQDDTATNRAQDNTAHAFYSWDRVSLYWTAEQVQDIQNNLELKANQDAIANVYDSSLTYAIWDIVVYNWDRYICSTAVSTPEEFDPTKRTKVNVQYELNSQNSRITALEEKWGSNMIDIFVLWGWGAWWSSCCYQTWWGWGAWWLVERYWVLLNKSSYNVVVWEWWSFSTDTSTRWRGCNWWNSSFWNIVALWWGWGWWGLYLNWSSAWWNWWNWWWWMSRSSWYWDWWYSLSWWSNWNAWKAWQDCKCWWGWWWLWWFFYRYCECYLWLWGMWIYTCFWWTTRCVGWWWWAYISVWTWRGWSYYWWGIATYNGDWCHWCPNTWWGWGWAMSATPTVHTWGCWWSWIVMVRYPTDCSYWIKTATWGTITTATINGIEYNVHTFTSDWTFEITETA